MRDATFESRYYHWPQSPILSPYMVMVTTKPSGASITECSASASATVVAASTRRTPCYRKIIWPVFFFFFFFFSSPKKELQQSETDIEASNDVCCAEYFVQNLKDKSNTWTATMFLHGVRVLDPCPTMVQLGSQSLGTDDNQNELTEVGD